MDPMLYNLIEPAFIFATLLGTAFGVKLLIWGKGPIRGRVRAEERQALEQRIAELEQRWDECSEVVRQQADQLSDMDERLDFTERMITRQQADAPPALNKPESPTPS
jgi:hypothetical protein